MTAEIDLRQWRVLNEELLQLVKENNTKINVR
jgi:hypothetical protein